MTRHLVPMIDHEPVRPTGSHREVLQYNGSPAVCPRTLVPDPARFRPSHTGSTDMHLLIEELSRDRMRQAQRDMETIRMVRRLRTASLRRDRRSTVRH